jgi:hypothetical protein
MTAESDADRMHQNLSIRPAARDEEGWKHFTSLLLLLLGEVRSEEGMPCHC